jgi:hypothetical protein
MKGSFGEKVELQLNYDGEADGELSATVIGLCETNAVVSSGNYSNDNDNGNNQLSYIFKNSITISLHV